MGYKVFVTGVNIVVVTLFFIMAFSVPDQIFLMFFGMAIFALIYSIFRLYVLWK